MTATVLPLHMTRDGLDPGPGLAALRAGAGVERISTLVGVDAWLVTRYADIRAVLSDPVRFSNAVPPLPGTVVSAPDGNLLALDPPDHTRLRRLLRRDFTTRQVARLRPRIEAIVTEHLDAMERCGPPADLVADFALPIPSLVICELLGVPWADRVEFQSRSARQLDLSLTNAERDAVQRERRAYMSGLVEQARRAPGADLLGMLVREHGEDLSHAELVGLADLLLLAGHETTSTVIGLAVLALLQRPEQLAALRDDPDAEASAVEELLRFLSVVHTGAPRIVTTDVEIAGVTIPAGDLVLCSLPAGNRDPAVIEDPDRLDLRRGAPGHLAFGHGLHHCLGAPLARAELQIALPALLRRLPRLALAVAPEEIVPLTSRVVYGLSALPVTW
jgi:cytochrome P450